LFVVSAGYEVVNTSGDQNAQRFSMIIGDDTVSSAISPQLFHNHFTI